MIRNKLRTDHSSSDVKPSDEAAQPRALCEDQQSIEQHLNAYKVMSFLFVTEYVE